MRILMMAVNDPAGTAIAFCNAVNRFTPHVCRLVTLETRYNHGWEQDLHLPALAPGDLCEVEALLRESDVFHFHMTADEDLALGPFLPRDFMAGKLVVHHHHGHPDFRGNPEKYRAKYRERGRTKILVSTPDLRRLCPEATWLPNLVPTADPLLSPMPGKPEAPRDEPMLVGHSPTKKELKNTDDLLAGMAELSAAGEPVRLDLIDDAPNRECLRRKRRCHVVFDHLQGYYGVSSLEALSQGVPTIAGIDAWSREHIARFTGTDDLPWVVCTPSTLTATLRSLAHEPERRAAIGRASREFMVERWNEALVAKRLVRFYES
ncbi:hypothetical protein dsx2_2045 [Desulfovibrio sp. X2]|uniref:glycosyltransferase family 4 protein n=1 Tax=Desulfovibrio sp. X2 TaxID=941449 RepID=UPI000358C9C3|nr:glycosyltransferase family 4 protein [Desulfovibrio sp. X2]EPR43935.1 hypothetical protein dsx2_2045 [Desulfovibrio sp. X2]